MTVGSTQPLTEMSTRNLPGGKGRSASKADNLTTICEPTVYKMWEPRRLTTLWGLYGLLQDGLTFFLFLPFRCEKYSCLVLYSLRLGPRYAFGSAYEPTRTPGRIQTLPSTTTGGPAKFGHSKIRHCIYTLVNCRQHVNQQLSEGRSVSLNNAKWGSFGSKPKSSFSYFPSLEASMIECKTPSPRNSWRNSPTFMEPED
jgi:hypothetical protein